MYYIHHSHEIQFWQCTRNIVHAEGVIQFVWMFPKKRSSSRALTLVFLLFLFLIKPSNFQSLIATSMPERFCFIPLRLETKLGFICSNQYSKTVQNSQLSLLIKLFWLKANMILTYPCQWYQCCGICTRISAHSLQWGQIPSFVNKSPHYWLPTYFQKFPPNFTTSQPFSNCIQIHYFNLYKTLLRPFDEGYGRVVVLRQE